MHNLATVLEYQGRYVEAEGIYRQALRPKQKVLGHEHSDTLHGKYKLAGALLDQGRYAEAEAMYRQTLQLTEKMLG